MQSLTTHTEEETIGFGAAFAKRLKGGDVVALYGDLGSGKTRFVQGVCKGLGVEGHVASPTFTIVNEYAVPDLNIYHVDLYRLNSLREIQDVGFEEYVNREGICLIEWAEKAEELLPHGRYNVRLTLGSNERAREISIEHVVEVSA